MEKQKFRTHKFNTSAQNQLANQETKENILLAKKRPQTTKLDIEKLFQQSIFLTRTHKQLSMENQKLKQEYAKIQQLKSNRQNLISNVEKIVMQKSKQFEGKNSQNSSWLVLKLNRQVSELKNKIEQKDKVIQNLKMNKENQSIRKKQVELNCLNELVNWATDQGLNSQRDLKANEQQAIKEIIWMDQYLKNQQIQLLDLQAIYERQNRELKQIMQKLSQKKAQLKTIKEMQNQYQKTQEKFREIKKKEENKMIVNKTYLSELQERKSKELARIQQLKAKFIKIQQDEKKQIQQLTQKIELLQEKAMLLEENKQCETKIVEQNKQDQNSSQIWMKYVSIEEILPLVANLNQSLALKRFDKAKYMQQFFKEKKEEYSISQICQIFKQYPFCIQDQANRLKLARYVVEDSDHGFVLMNLQMKQKAPIIRSILNKLIGQVKVYRPDQYQTQLQKTSNILSQYHASVVQIAQIKQGPKKVISKDKLIDAIQLAQLQLNPVDINFVILFLFSYSLDLNKLQLNKLGEIGKLPFKWQEQTQNSIKNSN